MNRNAATEDEIGKLHNLITQCHNLKANKMLSLAQRLIDAGEEPEIIMQAINTRDLASMQKWVEYNGVSCTVAAEDETSELSKKLKKLKDTQMGKVIPFEEPEAVNA